MPTYRTNALYQAPTVDNAVYEQFGMQPGMDRLNLLPRHDAKLGWIAPNALYQVARALVSPSVAAQGGYVSPEDGVNFAGNVSLGSLGTSALVRNPAPGPGRTVAQTVYHGSPHNFDKFDMSKIGTGEGAQAYGHGLYVAESPTVAKSYSVNLANRDQNNQAYLTAHANAQQWGNRFNGDEEYTLQVMRDNLDTNPRLADTISMIESGDYKKPIKQGHLYHVDLPDQHIANMLDWDKPLSQQPAHVQDAVKAAFSDAGIPNAWKFDPDGNSVNAWLSSAMKDSQKASALLREKGLAGIKYLDGGSRGAGDGTRNFVVFDDKLLKVLKKE